MTTDLEYSSFLIQQSMLRGQKKTTKDGNEEEEEEEEESPGKEEYRQSLLNALSRHRSQPRQRGVLSFKPSTPSASRERDIFTIDTYQFPMYIIIQVRY